MFVSCIWAALARSFDSLLAATIVGSFGGASTETLVAATVNVRLVLSRHRLYQGHLQGAQDLFFLHERGAKMGSYIVAISWGSTFGPLCGGFMIDRKFASFCSRDGEANPKETWGGDGPNGSVQYL
jgi:MFS family permease